MNCQARVEKRSRPGGRAGRTRSRRSVRLATVGVVAMVTAACGAAPAKTGTTGGSSKAVNLSYALWDPNQLIGYQKVAKAFEKKNPSIHVTVEEYPASSYFTKLFTELASGTGPDVFWANNLNFLQLVKQHNVLAQTSFIKRSHVNTGAYVPGLMKFFQLNGQIYALPKDWDTIGIVYNKALFKKYHVTMPSSLTWNPSSGGSFLRLAEKLTVDSNGVHAGQPGFNPAKVANWGVISENDTHEDAYNFIAMNGGQFLKKEYGKTFTFNSPAATSAMQFLVNLILRYHVSPSASLTNPPLVNPGQQLFLQGHVAMYMAGDWHLRSIGQGAKFPWGVAELPKGPDGRMSVINSLGNFINAKTRHPNAAWKFVKFLSGPQAAKIMGSGGYIWPSLSAYDSLFANYWKAHGVNVTPFLKEAQGKTILNPVTYNFNAASLAMNNIFNLMYLGKLSVPAALGQAVAVGNKDAGGGS